ncbi:hypothetical protein D8M06_13510 [Oceanobacillus halophilus]|uniref:Uncharacterized protein n=1 Tax=Oceanobacillus halophilus TaxID=930130 RepID=A0A494ZXL9_9BACI|nr:hypothetical protein D8M06_13510 [Oceanobacillus halophilus]
MNIQVVPSLRSLTDAHLPAGQGMLRQGYIARRKKWFSFFKESPCISAMRLLYLYKQEICCFKDYNGLKT